MSNLSAFLKNNVAPVEPVKFVATKRIKDEKGKPVEWELTPISSSLDEAIRKECTKTVVGKRGARTREFDSEKYGAKVSVATTTFPNLNDAELQDSYGVKTPEALLKALLCTAGEYTDYQAKVLEVNGFDMSMDDMIEDAKN